MDNDKLSKKFHDKKFLKSSNFHDAVTAVLMAFEENKLYFVFALIVALALIIAVPSFKFYRLKRVQSFNQKLYDLLALIFWSFILILLFQLNVISQATFQEPKDVLFHAHWLLIPAALVVLSAFNLLV